jgi:opacity protein-like surface antigen
MRKIAIAALVLVLAAAPALAAETAQGDQELAFTFSYSDTDFGDVDGIDLGELKTTVLEGRWGYYLTGMHELGLDVSYAKTELEDLDTDSTTLGIFYNLNFQTAGSAIPYIGAFVDTLSGDLGDSYSLAYGLEGGVKIYPWEHAGFNLRASWTQLTGDDNDGFEIPDADAIGLGAGLLVKW